MLLTIKKLSHDRLLWVAFLALMLGLWGITYALPDLVLPDEPALTRGALTMMSERTLIPSLKPDAFRALYYPPLGSWIYLIGLAPVIGGIYLLGGYASLSALAAALILDPTVPWLTTRIMNAFIGAIAVYVLGKVAERIQPGAGVYAALFLALSFFRVQFAHVPRHWMLTLVLISLMIYAAHRILYDGSRRWYVSSGVLAGLAALNAVVPMVLLLLPAFAHLARGDTLVAKLKDRNAWCMGGIALAGLALTFLLHYQIVYDLFFGQVNTFGQAKSLMGAATTIIASLKTLLITEPTIALLSLVGLFFLFKRDSRWATTLVGSIFVVLLVLYRGSIYEVLPHYLLLVLPLLIMLSAEGCRTLFESIQKKGTKLVFAVLIFGIPLLVAARLDLLLAQKDTRHLARAYVETMIDPATTRVYTNVDLTKIVWPTKAALLERLRFDPTSSRLVDRTLLQLSDDAYPKPAFNLFEARAIGFRQGNRQTELLNEEWFQKQKFTHLILEGNPNGIDPAWRAVEDGKVLAVYPKKNVPAIDIFDNYWGGPVIDLFRMERLGPPIRIIQMTQDK